MAKGITFIFFNCIIAPFSSYIFVFPILQKHFNPNDGGLMTITNVSMTSDLRLARIMVSFINNERSETSLVQELNSKDKFYKFQIAQKWHAKFMPDIEFRYDEIIIMDSGGRRADILVVGKAHSRESSEKVYRFSQYFTIANNKDKWFLHNSLLSILD